MAKKKTIDVEDREAQENLDRITAEGRTLRKLNDTLHAENRNLKKENNGLQERNKSLTSDIAFQKHGLKTLKGNKDKIESEHAKERNAIAREKKEVEGLIEKNEATRKEALDCMANALKDKCVIDKKRDALKYDQDTFKAEKEEVRQLGLTCDRQLKHLDIEIDNASRLVTKRNDALDDVGKEKAKLEIAIAEANKTNDLYLAKRLDAINAENQTKAQNENLVEAQKFLDAKNKEVEKLKTTLKIATDEAKAKERSFVRSIEELDSRDKEIGTREMILQRVLRNKGIADKFKKIQEEMAA